MSRNGEKFEIFFSNFLAHPVETPWPILTVLQSTPECAQICALHIGLYIWHR